MSYGDAWRGICLVYTWDRYASSSAKGQCTSYEIHACMMNSISTWIEHLNTQTHTPEMISSSFDLQ